MARRVLGNCACTCALVLGLTATAPAEIAELLWIAPGVENILAMEAIDDVDGDGGPDIVFESYDAGAPAVDHVLCIRGASTGTGEVIWGARPLGGPSNSGGYGDNCLRIAPDITGDGHDDVLLATAWGSRSAFVLDGLNGDTFWSFDTYSDTPPVPAESGWVYAIDAVPDLNNDGIPEVTFCTGNYNRGVYLTDGATGSVLWFFQGSGPFFDVRCVGDVDGNGSADVAAGAGDDYKVLLCLSGPGIGGAPDVLWQVPYPNTIMSLLPLESIDADPEPEVVAGCWDGHVRCHDGATGTTHWTSDDFLYSVQRVARVGDVNADEIDDLVVGLWDNRVVVLSGLDGSTIWVQWVGTLNGGDTWAVDGAGDVTGDKIPEVVVGSFDTNVYLMDGFDGTILWNYPTGNRVMTVRGAPDLNGNGSPDVVGGTQMLSSSGGIVYALDGRPPSAGASELTRIEPAALRLWPNPLLAASGRPLQWGAAVPRGGHFVLQVVGADGRILRTLEERHLAGAEWVQGAWSPRDAGGGDVPAGVVWVRALLDGRLLASGRTVLVR